MCEVFEYASIAIHIASFSACVRANVRVCACERV